MVDNSKSGQSRIIWKEGASITLSPRRNNSVDYPILFFGSRLVGVATFFPNLSIFGKIAIAAILRATRKVFPDFRDSSTDGPKVTSEDDLKGQASLFLPILTLGKARSGAKVRGKPGENVGFLRLICVNKILIAVINWPNRIEQGHQVSPAERCFHEPQASR